MFVNFPWRTAKKFGSQKLFFWVNNHYFQLNLSFRLIFALWCLISLSEKTPSKERQKRFPTFLSRLLFNLFGGITNSSPFMQDSFTQHEYYAIIYRPWHDGAFNDLNLAFRYIDWNLLMISRLRSFKPLSMAGTNSKTWTKSEAIPYLEAGWICSFIYTYIYIILSHHSKGPHPNYNM